MVAPQGNLIARMWWSSKREIKSIFELCQCCLKVLLNLLLNANDVLKTRYGAGSATEGIIKATIKRRSQLVAIIIEDDRMGIPTDLLSKMFDPFSPPQSPRRREQVLVYR